MKFIIKTCTNYKRENYPHNKYNVNGKLVLTMTVTNILPLWPVCVFNLWHKQFNHIKGLRAISLLFLMHSGIVNGHQLL